MLPGEYANFLRIGALPIYFGSITTVADIVYLNTKKLHEEKQILGAYLITYGYT